MARACDDECCEFRTMHQIKFQSLVQVYHVYKNVWSPYKGETLIAQPDNQDEAQEDENMLLEFTIKAMMNQKNWLAMHQLSFQAYCIIFFKQVLKIVSMLK